MFFAHNKCCSVPLHLLLTDLIDSQGGSSELIRILNRFGAVASNDTHRRYVQFKVQQKMKSGYLNDLNLNSPVELGLNLEKIGTKLIFV